MRKYNLFGEFVLGIATIFVAFAVFANMSCYSVGIPSKISVVNGKELDIEEFIQLKYNSPDFIKSYVYQSLELSATEDSLMHLGGTKFKAAENGPATIEIVGTTGKYVIPLEVYTPIEEIVSEDYIGLILNYKDSLNFNTQYLPESASGFYIAYASSNPSVVDISGNKIIAKSIGEAVLTVNAKSEYTDEVLVSKLVTVKVDEAPMDVVVDDVSMVVGEMIDLAIKVVPETSNVGNKFKIICDSDAFTISDRTITANKGGEAVLIVENEYGIRKEINIAALDPEAEKEGKSNALVEIKEEPIALSDDIAESKPEEVPKTVAFSRALPKSGQYIGQFLYPKAGINLKLIWDGRAAAIDGVGTAEMSSDCGIPGDMDRNVFIQDHDYQSGKILANNLVIGDEVIVNTNYGKYVYRFVEKNVVNENPKIVYIPSETVARYNMSYAGTNDDLILKNGSSLCKSSLPNKKNSNRLYFGTCWGSQIMLMEFEFCSGPKLK